MVLVFYTGNWPALDWDRFDWVELVEINMDHVFVQEQPSLVDVVVVEN